MSNLVAFDTFGTIKKPFNWLLNILLIASIVGIGLLAWRYFKKKKENAKTLIEIAEENDKDLLA